MDNTGVNRLRVSSNYLSFAYCPGVSLRYTPPRPTSRACSKACLPSRVPRLLRAAGSLIFSGSTNVNVLGRGVELYLTCCFESYLA